MSRVLIGAMAVLLATSLLLAHGAKPWPVPDKAKRRKNPVAATPESVKEGALLYSGNCLVCHGAKGDGNGPQAGKLPRKPADFTDWKKMNDMTDGEIFWKMSTGRDPMPSFVEKLSEEQRWHLVNYLRTLAKQ
ncbi:MAG: c-type cytochrome [Candidatus Binatia bacterium]